MPDKKIRDLIFETVMGAVVKGVTTAIPFFNLPVIKTIFTFIVMKVAGLIYEELSRYAVFSLIDLRVEREKTQYLAAVERLRNAKPEDEKDAEEEFKRTLRNLISLKRP